MQQVGAWKLENSILMDCPGKLFVKYLPEYTIKEEVYEISQESEFSQLPN